mmetsp:Transcript_10180/g.22940  ORF Transcript_10180/g.22940 Transcript_10180/m.22940 type:complete len:473 (-) Transcript_10180:30-1448(-)
MTSLIPFGAHVVLRDHEGGMKVFKLPDADKPVKDGEKPATLHMGKYAPIPVSLVASVPYGATLRVAESGGWERYRQPAAEDAEVESAAAAQSEEVYETNAHLPQDNSAQSLSPEEITTMKSTKCDGEEVIAALVSGSATFSSKTKFAKEKYLNKKRMKHIQQVVVLRPTLIDLCETYMKMSRQKICGLRFDYLASILCQADVRTGGRYLVVDSACGLVAGAVAQQLAGEGRVYRFYAKGIADRALTELDLGARLRSVVRTIPLGVVLASEPAEQQWLKMPTFAPSDQGAVEATETAAAAPTGEGDGAAEEERKARFDAKVERVTARRDDFENLTNGHWMDAVIVVAGEEDADLAEGALEWGLKHLKPSGRVVIYDQHLQQLAAQQAAWRGSAEFVDVRLVQLFTREYQVLPQRTHPHMTAEAHLCEGFLLAATKVLPLGDEDEAGGPKGQSQKGRGKGAGGGGPPRKRQRRD